MSAEVSDPTVPGRMTYLTQREAAAFLGVSQRQFQRLPVTCYRASERVVRYLESDLIAYMNKRAVEPRVFIVPTRRIAGSLPKAGPGIRDLIKRTLAQALDS